MTDIVERLLNLALYFASTTRPVTAEDVRDNVAGYPADQDDASFARMFERDKDELRHSGFTIGFDEEHQRYSLDRGATFSAPLVLAPEEAAVLRVVGSAMLDDPAFPFAADLRLALTKIAAESRPEEALAFARLADENPSAQGEAVAVLSGAVERGKTAHFDYTNSQGASAPHEIEPYGTFLRHGRWYLVGRDTSLDQVRTYAISRMAGVVVNAAAPKTPDFERPAGFDVSDYIRLPFQYGPPEEEFEAELRFDSASSWRARSLTAEQGTLEPDGDGLRWRIAARSPENLIRFVFENGPGIDILAPGSLLERLEAGLVEVEALHG